MSVTGVSLYAASYSESGTAATDPMKNGGSGAFKPLPTQGYDANVYTIGGNWEAMESAGAVFLPATNFRKGTIFDQYASGRRLTLFVCFFLWLNIFTQ